MGQGLVAAVALACVPFATALSWTGAAGTARIGITIEPDGPQPAVVTSDQWISFEGTFTWLGGEPHSGTCHIKLDGVEIAQDSESWCEYDGTAFASGMFWLPQETEPGEYSVTFCSEVCSGDVTTWTETVRLTVVEPATYEPQPEQVPEVRCIPVDRAVLMLEELGFEPRVDNTDGWVVGQEPTGGSAATFGKVVYLDAVDPLLVPDVDNLDFAAASEEVEHACQTLRPDGPQQGTVVVEQFPTAYSPAKPGGVVFVTLESDDVIDTSLETTDTTSPTRVSPTTTPEPTEDTGRADGTQPTAPTSGAQTTIAVGGGGGNPDDAGPFGPLGVAWPDSNWVSLLLLVGLAVLALAGGRLGRTLRLRQDRGWVATHVTLRGTPAVASSLVDSTASPPGRPDLGMAFVAVRRLSTIHIEDLT